MLEDNNVEILLSILEKKYSFLKLNKEDFSDLVSLISANTSLEGALLLCEEEIAKRILLDKQVEKNIDLVKKYIKNLSKDKSYKPVQKLRMLGLLFSGGSNIRENAIYMDLMKNNPYLENIISEITEEDYNTIFEDKFSTFILEDKQKYDNEEENDNNIETLDTFISGDDEFSEIIKSYKYLYPNILTIDEERELLRKIKEGNKYAKEELVGHNWKLVLSITKKYLSSGIYIADLFQEGNLGLLKAIDRFDLEKGFKLSTYASWWIRQGIERYITNNSRMIRYPDYIYKKVYLIRNTYNQIKRKCGYNPSPEELAEIVDMEVQEVIELLNLPEVSTSLNQEIGEKEDDELEELIADPNALSPEDYTEKSILVDEIKEYLDRMPEREAKIIRMRFGLDDINNKGKTLEVIGKELGVTRERIRQLEKKALRRLKKIIHMQKIPSNSKNKGSYDKSYYETKAPRFIKNPYEYYSEYSKEDIDLIASTLPDEKRKIYEERFKEGGCSAEIRSSYINVDSMMYNRLRGLKIHFDEKEKYIEKLKRLNNRKKTTRKKGKIDINNVYDYFKEYSREDIDLVVSSLPKDLKEIHDERFKEGGCSSDVHSIYVKKTAIMMKKRLQYLQYHEENKEEYIASIIKKRNAYGSKKKAKNIYEYFSDFTKEEIDVVVNWLSDEKRKIYEERFKEGGCSEEIINKFNSSVAGGFRAKLVYNRKNEGNIGGKKVGRQPAKNIYEYFNKFSKEDIDRVIEELNLNSDNKRLLSKRFSENERPSSDIIKTFTIKLAPKIKSKLKKQKTYTLKEEMNKRQVDASIELNSAKSQNKDLKELSEEIINVKKEDINEEGFKEINNRLVETLNVNDENHISQIFKTPLFKEKTRDLPYESMIIVALKLGYFSGREYSSIDIANFLGIQVETVNSIVTRTLKDYKKDIIHMFYDIPSRDEANIDKGIPYIKSIDKKN